MTIEYQTYTDNILNRVNYGMPNFGKHTNYFFADLYSTDKANLVDEVLERAIPMKSSDEEFLDTMLRDIDGKERNQVIEKMIQEREALRVKAKDRIENAKDHLRDMKYSSTYDWNQGMPAKDITKLYDDLNRLSREEDVKAWKDISFLRVKLWDEGMTGGDSNEDS